MATTCISDSQDKTAAGCPHARGVGGRRHWRHWKTEEAHRIGEGHDGGTIAFFKDEGAREWRDAINCNCATHCVESIARADAPIIEDLDLLTGFDYSDTLKGVSRD
jgi:hypothetical protein